LSLEYAEGFIARLQREEMKIKVRVKDILIRLMVNSFDNIEAGP
jgi:hypothetical protein